VVPFICCSAMFGAAPVPFWTLKVISVRLMSGVLLFSVFWFSIMSVTVAVRLVLLFRLLLFIVAFLPVCEVYVVSGYVECCFFCFVWSDV